MMSKEAVDAAITSIEGTISTIDTWVLIFAALVAIGIVGETVLSVNHWRLDRQLRPLGLQQAQLHEREIAELNVALERERTLRVRMQKEITWRRIKPDQATKLVQELHTHPLKVNLQAVDGDPESTLFGDDIRRVLVAAGFTVNATLKNFSGPIHGLGLSANPPNERASVVSAFQAAGFEFGDDTTPTDILTIIVGSKMPANPELLSDVAVPVLPAK